MQKTSDVVEVVCFAEGPEEALGDFIANGDDVHGEPVRGEGVAHFEGVVIETPC